MVLNKRRIYKEIDVVISPSYFLANKLKHNVFLKEKIVVMHNFSDDIQRNLNETKEDYVLYFGRYSFEKGINTLLQAVDELTNIHFVFVGSGPLEDEINKRKNVTNKGFLKGKELWQVIAKAKLTIVPSEFYENCPFTILESQALGTPVLGSNLGGIPELVEKGKTGDLFESGNKLQLKQKIIETYEKSEEYSRNCRESNHITLDEYTNRIIRIYLDKNW